MGGFRVILKDFTLIDTKLRHKTQCFSIFIPRVSVGHCVRLRMTKDLLVPRRLMNSFVDVPRCRWLVDQLKGALFD
jgi:hypothetical protein